MTLSTPRGEPAAAHFRHLLETAAAALDITLSATQTEQLLGYLASLQRWNSVYNLTSVREPDQMLRLHLLDCLALINPLRQQVGVEKRCRLLDVGSGAGLPGVVIAIVEPSISVTCVDAVGKKTAFVQHVAAELSLSNLASIHTRIEQLKAAPFQLITSRAFASLADFVRLTRPNLAPGGKWLAMKGKLPRDEMLQLPADIEVFHVEPLAVPGLDAERCIVWMRSKA